MAKGESGNSGWMGAAAAGIAGGIQGLFQSAGLKRRYKYAKKMADYEHDLQKQMNQYNAGLALQQWKDTNAPAQVEQLRKAGLSTGLIYGMSGAGGTASTNTGAGTHAGNMNLPNEEGFRFMGLEAGLQVAAQKAQIELTKAQKNNVEADTTKKLGVDTQQVLETIENLKSRTTNQNIQNSIDNLNKEIKEVEKRIAQETESDIVTKINAEKWKTIGEAESAEAKGEIDKETKEDIIEQIEQYTIEQSVRIASIKANINLTNAEIKQTYNAIENLKQNTEINWNQLNINEKEVKIKEELMKFNTSDAARLKQWSDAIMPAVEETMRKRAPINTQRRVERGQKGRWSLPK